jgi:hypothetical protein
MLGNVSAELGNPWISRTAGRRLSPAVTKDRSVPPVNLIEDLVTVVNPEPVMARWLG